MKQALRQEKLRGSADFARKPDFFPAPRKLEAYSFATHSDEFLVFVYRLPSTIPPPGLTPAERAVVFGVVRGLSNSEIAAERGTSPRTVANQLHAVFAKLGVSSRAELVALGAGRVR
jgi:DNA-binding CsgD family transcriptional regulator